MFYDVVIYAVVITFVVTTYGLQGSTTNEFVLAAFLLFCAYYYVVQ